VSAKQSRKAKGKSGDSKYLAKLVRDGHVTDLEDAKQSRGAHFGSANRSHPNCSCRALPRTS
jgi:hypothetical protein